MSWLPAFTAARGFNQIRRHSTCETPGAAMLHGARTERCGNSIAVSAALSRSSDAPGPGSTIAAPVEGLDLATVINVSQAVSGEIVLEKLSTAVMRKAMEHAGAERGLLISSARR